MSSTLESIKAKLAEAENKYTELVEEIRKEFPPILQSIFEKSAKIETVGWRQYTPYFNDGDECEFSTCHDDLIVNGDDEYDLSFGKYSKEGKDDNECALIEEFTNTLSEIPDDIYKSLFGDHCTVTVSKGGTIEVEEYEHD